MPRLTLPSQTQSDQCHTSTAFQTPFRVNQIITQCKETYLEHWKEETKSQTKLECHLALKRDYELAEHLSTVSDRKQRQILTKYRLRDHKLAIEKVRHKKPWSKKENRHVLHIYFNKFISAISYFRVGQSISCYPVCNIHINKADLDLISLFFSSITGAASKVSSRANLNGLLNYS